MSKPFTSQVHSPLKLTAEQHALLKSKITKGKTAPLYVYRSVDNAAEIIKWAKDQGFKTTLKAEDLHVTVIYSRNSVDWFKLGDNWSGDWETGKLKIRPGGPRAMAEFGKGAIVLQFQSGDLWWRNKQAQEMGASWDYDDYQPHITITYDKGDVDLDTVKPYNGKIELGPEVFEPIDLEWSDKIVEKAADKNIYKIAAVDEEAGIVFGWAMVSKINDVDYYDLNFDRDTMEFVPEHIPEDAMFKSAIGFMDTDRAGNDMHEGPDIGKFVFGFPLTTEIAKAMGIECDRTGFMVGFRPENAEILEKFKTKEYTGFSIEGFREAVVEVND